MTPLEALQAKLIQEQQAKIEVLTERLIETEDAHCTLLVAYAELQIKKAHTEN